MPGSVTYSILSAGGVVDGHDPENVIAQFCKTFKVDADKAAVYIEKQKLIKKDLTQAQAIAYREHFTKIGVPVTVKKHKPVKPDDFGGLSLTPANDPTSDGDDASADADSAAKPKAFSCPKCNKEQKQSATCVSCGIIFEKYEAALARVSYVQDKSSKATPPEKSTAATASSAPSVKATATATEKPAKAAAVDDSNSAFDGDVNRMACIAAAAVIAIVGAFIWKTIAISTGTEFGLLAWVIGGAIGVGAAFFGANDHFEGVICAGICVLAIAGGKYMIAGDFVDLFSGEGGLYAEIVSEIKDEFGDDVQAFASVGDDEKSIKRFMVEYGYSSADNAQGVEDYEYDGFVEYSMPMLQELHANPDDFANSPVFSELFFAGEEMDSEVLTRGDMFKEMWGPLDLLFLFFGAMTAYQMANGRGSQLLNKG